MARALAPTPDLEVLASSTPAKREPGDIAFSRIRGVEADRCAGRLRAARRPLALLLALAGAGMTSMAPLGPVAASAAPVPPFALPDGGANIVAFSDAYGYLTNNPVTSELAPLRTLYCAGWPERPAQVALSSAISAAEKLVSGASDGRGAAAFAASREGHDEPDALAAAASALAGGEPSAALAALLRAHELAPSDPVPLVDAAPLLAEAGRGNDALAFLHAATTAFPSSQPFGIPWPAVVAADQGQALITLGEYGPAEISLSRAISEAPLLTEADQNMGVALDCQGKTTAAKPYLLAALTRQQFRSDEVTPGPENFPPLVDPADLFDMSHPQQLTWPTFKTPANVLEGKQMIMAMQDLEQTDLKEQEDMKLPWAAFEAEQARENLATRDRQQAILDAEGTLAAHRPVVSPPEGGGTVGQNGCPDPTAVFQRFRTYDEAYTSAMERWESAVYARQTALAADLANPIAHQLAVDQARYQALGTMVQITSVWSTGLGFDGVCCIYSQYKDECLGASQVADVQAGNLVTPASKRCSSPSIKLKLAFISVTMTCEEVSVEVSPGAWEGVFVGGSHNFRTGKDTLMIGGKASIAAGGGIGAGGKIGAYVSFGPDGGLVDAGVRTSAGVSLSDLPVGLNLPSTSFTWSMVSGFTWQGMP